MSDSNQYLTYGLIGAAIFAAYKYMEGKDSNDLAIATQQASATAAQAQQAAAQAAAAQAATAAAASAAAAAKLIPTQAQIAYLTPRAGQVAETIAKILLRAGIDPLLVNNQQFEDAFYGRIPVATTTTRLAGLGDFENTYLMQPTFYFR